VKVRDVIRLIELVGGISSGRRAAIANIIKSGTVTVAGHPSDFLHPKALATIEGQAGLK